MGTAELVCWNLVCPLAPNVLLPHRVDIFTNRNQCLCAYENIHRKKTAASFFSFLFFLSSKQIQVLSNLHNNFY